MKRFTGIITAVVFAILFMAFFTSAYAAQKTFTPTASSPTAMVKCGAKLEEVKTRLRATQRYEFTGNEKLVQMRFCISEARGSVVDRDDTYRVPKGTIGWLAADGRIVLEDCVNEALCQGCAPPTPVATAPPPTAPAPQPVAPPVSYRRLVVNFFQDDGALEKQYSAADTQWKRAAFGEGRLEGSAYRIVFTNAPFPEMKARRDAAPLIGKFVVTYLRHEPSLQIGSGDAPQVRKQKYFTYLTQLRESSDSVVSRIIVTTNKRGYIVIPLPPLDSFAVLVVFPVDPAVDLVGDIPMFVHSSELRNGPEPAHLWAAQRSVN